MARPDSFIAFCDLSPESRILWLSPSAYDLLGFEPEDLIGVPGFDVVYPDEHADVRQFLKEYVSNDLIASQMVIRFMMKDGQQLLCALIGCVCYDFTVEIIKVHDPDVEKCKSADRFLAMFVLMGTHDN
jgi:PAS domain S-box-containing protein